MKNFKRIVALMIAILVLIPFGAMFSTSAATANLAVNATASTGMNLLANQPVTNIIDTNPSDGGSNWAAVSYVDGLAWFQLDFATAQTVNKVSVFNNQEPNKAPIDYAIDVKTSNGVWTRVAEKHNFGVASYRNFYFAPVSDVVAVRVTANKNGNSSSGNFMVVSFMVYNESAVTSADYTGVTAGTGNRVIPQQANSQPSGGQQGGAVANLAVNATPTAGSDLLANQPITNIIDTNPSDNGNNWAAVKYVDGLAWYQLDFATAQTVNKVLVFNNQETANAPADLAIDVKTTDGKWTRVAEKHGLEVATAHTQKDSKYTSRNFCFAPVSNVVAVRVTANKNGNSNSNNFMVVSLGVYNDSSVTSVDYTGVTAGTGNLVIPAIDTPAGGGNDDDDNQQGGQQGGGQQGAG